MKKIKILIDLDNTLVNSSETACKVYELKTGQFADLNKITDYHFDEVMPLWNRQQQNDIFISKLFYDLLKPMENSMDVLKQLKSEGHELIICSITHYDGMKLKREWVNRHLGNCIDSVILIDNFKQGDSTVRMNKDVIIGDLILDDHIGNLINNKSKYKILFGDNAYSKGWKGLKAHCWSEVYWLVHMISKIEE